MEKQKFIRGALILTISGILCKALGAIYRIPLGNTIGTEGMGFYQMAYPVYSVLIVLSSAGIPVALSRMVSEALARGETGAANEIFRVSRRALALLGIASAIFLFAASGLIARTVGLEGTAFSLKMLAPSLVFVAVVSVYRGALQGRQLMGATAVSQVCEQIVRLTLGLYLAAAWMPQGSVYGAGGALLGVTFSEIAGLAVVVGYYAAKRRSFGDIRISVDKFRRREILRELFRIAFPITLGACTMSVVGAIDSAIVMRVLTGNGFSTAEATGLFGLLTGFVQPIVNMPAVLSGALAMSIVPTVSAAFALKDHAKVRRQADFAHKLSCLIGMPCSVGLYLLAEPALAAIYPNLSAAELVSAAQMMRIMAPGIFFMSISQVSSGVLQGIGRTVYPVLSMLLATMVKLFLGIWLIRIPAVNIMGAAWGTLLYFAINAAVDVLFAVRFAGMRTGMRDVIPRTVLCSAGMGAIVYLLREYTALSVWITVLAGAVGYGILLIVSGTLCAEEIEGMIGSARAEKILFWRRIGRKV